jgi:hypothetical protein
MVEENIQASSTQRSPSSKIYSATVEDGSIMNTQKISMVIPNYERHL